MTSPVAPSPRPWGGAAIAAAAIGIALAVMPFAETVSTFAGTASAADLRYVAQILVLEAPRLAFGPLAVAIVTFLSFGAVAPIRASLRMAQVVRRAFATAVVALLAAGVVAAVVAVATLLGAYGRGALSASVGQALGMAGRVIGSVIGQFAGQLDVLLAVPLGALLLWGWLRREPMAREV
jgi:hypothetical protein